MNRSSNKVDIPKNIRQIGHALTDNKIYIEDYVMTYLKQMYREPFENEKLLILIGNSLCEDGVNYLFVKGVIELDKDIKKVSEILENETISKITRTKEDFFYDEDIIGLGIISKNEWLGFDEDIRMYFNSGMVGNTVVVYDINEEERLYSYSNIGFVRERGYYIYYDRNECMQNYMLCMKDGKSIEYGYAKTEVVDRTIDEKIRTYAIPKNTVYTSKNIDFNKYKNYFEKKLSKKVRFCSTVICVASILCVGLVKLEKFEEVTRKKAKDLYGITKDVMSDNDVLEIETVVEDSDEVKKEDKKIDLEVDNNVEGKTEKKIDEKNDNSNEDEIVNKKRQSTEEKVVNKYVNKENIQSEKINYYIVKKGDALVDISRKIYGTIRKVDSIKKANGLQDEDKIFIGQKLVMP